MSLKGTIFPKGKELKDISLLFFPKGYLGLELICYGMLILFLLFFNIFGGMLSFIVGFALICVGSEIQLRITRSKKHD